MINYPWHSHPHFMHCWGFTRGIRTGRGVTRGDRKYFVGIWNTVGTFLGSLVILSNSWESRRGIKNSPTPPSFSTSGGHKLTWYGHCTPPCSDICILTQCLCVATPQCNQAPQTHIVAPDNLLGIHMFLLILGVWLILAMPPTLSYSNVILQSPSETWMSEMFVTKQKLIKSWNYPKVSETFRFSRHRKCVW